MGILSVVNQLRPVCLLPIFLFLSGCSPAIIAAARKDDVKAAKAALDSGGDPNARGGYRHGETALMIAAARGSVPMASLLIENGSKPGAPGGRGETPLMRAAEHGHLELVKLLAEHGADLNAKGVQGTTALHYAVQNGQTDIASYLLGRGADINAVDEMNLGRTPLGIAAYYGDADLVRLLLEHGADPRVAGNNGNLPAQQALWQAHFAVARLIKDFTSGKTLPPAAPAPAPSDVDIPTYALRKSPDSVAIVVGVGPYTGLPEAAFAEHDAESVAAHLAALGFQQDRIFLLTGFRATRAGLVKTLEGRLAAAVTLHSTVFFYFAGYGAVDVKTGAAYLLPLDGDPEYLAETAYPLARLYEKLSALGAKTALAVLDCGFSGHGGRSAAAGPAAAEISLPVGVQALLAASPAETASTQAEHGHGILTYEFLRGLNGAALESDGSVTLKSLATYLSQVVPIAAKRLGLEQHPLLRPENAALRLR
jgi:hypothetical protein